MITALPIRDQIKIERLKTIIDKNARIRDNANEHSKRVIEAYNNANAQHYEQLTVGQFYNKFLKDK